MENQYLALFLSFSFVFLILFLTTAASKIFKLSEDLSRKIVHIAVGHWIILGMALFSSLPLLLITPISFVLINYLSYKYKIFKVMEQNDDSLGTVWYALSLLILSAAGFLLKQKEIAVIAILIMAYGDGMAALLGKKFGRRHWPVPYEKKTPVGSFTMFLFSFGVCLLTYGIMLGQIRIVHSILLALVATMAELVAKKGRDNLYVPLLTGLLAWMLSTRALDGYFWGMMLLALLVLAMGYYKKSITFSALVHGLWTAFLLLYFGGKMVFGALILFFILGSLASKVGKNQKKPMEKLQKRTGPRDVVQVYANAGGAIIMSMCYYATGNDIFHYAALVTFVAALADTISSEIGMLSKKEPISIVTFQKMQPGLSGGVTLLGILAALGASVLFSVLLLNGSMREVMLVSLLGFTGSLIDSLIGALFQAKYYVSKWHMLTERETIDGEKLSLKSGFKKINNDTVNFISTLLAGLLYLGIRLLA